MKELLRTILVVIFFVSAFSVSAQSDELPSESYYKENIAVNEIDAASTILKRSGDDDALDPGAAGWGSAESPFVGAPVGDAIYPLAVALIGYMAFIVYRRREQKTQK